MSAKPKRKPSKRGKWVFVPEDERAAEEIQEEKEQWVVNMLSPGTWLTNNPFAVVDQFYDYFPGDNEVPEDGAWVLVRKSPQTEYTVPPLSIWFATPWPMESHALASPSRVKIVTPRGDLGLFPREYSIVRDPAKYFEFIGEGMTFKFFGGDTSGVPELPLFYLRSRGIAKRDAITMLLGHIKSHGVLWIETTREIASAFLREGDWPDESRLATSGAF